jgi:UDP-glucose:(heptosyl)LPS alpha-1,3-glucosyltransferase
MPEQQKLYIIRKEYDGFGGAENVAKRYIDHFSAHFDTELVYAGAYLDNHRFNGNKGPGWWKSLSFSNSVNHFLGKRNDSIIFSMTRGIAGHVFRVGDGVHHRWLAHNNSSFLKRFFNPNHLVSPRLEKQSIEHSKWIVPNSKMIAREISSEYPQCAKKIKVIHNGFDPNRFQFANEATRAELKEESGAIPEAMHLFFCANGWERKGLSHTLKLISQINQKSRCHLWVVGRGNQRHFTKQCYDLGITKNVSFLGSQQNVNRWYQMADLFVLPTAYDPFSNSCLEALACGCPVITTSSNGASECINSHNGLVVHSPKEVFSKPAVNWALGIQNFDRSKISQSVSKLTSENEIKAYLELLKSND